MSESFIQPQPEIRLASPFANQAVVAVEGVRPEILGLYDAHLMPPRALEDGRPSSAKRRIFGFITAISRLCARNDMASRIAVDEISRAAAAAPNSSEAIFYIGGDNIDACSLTGFFYCMRKLEHFCAHRALSNKAVGNPLPTIVATGNHDMAFRGPDNLVDYAGVPLPLIPNDVFSELVKLCESGMHMQEMYELIKQLYPRNSSQQFKIHPAQKWFLTRKVFGHEIGAFTFADPEFGHRHNLVAFLNSELGSKGRSLVDLNHVTTHTLKLLPEDPVAQSMLQTYQENEARQQQVIELLLADDCLERRVVYTHNPVLMQKKLVHAYMASMNVSMQIAKEWVVNNIVIYGGHYHVPLAGHDNIVHVAGASRQAACVLVQKPHSRSPFGMIYGLHALGAGDEIEFLIGQIRNPTQVSISGEQISERLARLQPPCPTRRASLKQTLQSANYNLGFTWLQAMIAAL